MAANVPPVPGFAGFLARIQKLSGLPQAWTATLASVRRVYLLVAEDGARYVGAAIGAEKFVGRWLAYAANGHGGNILLQRACCRDYAVSIQEVASPDMAASDILAREAFWKQRPGARAYGLNAN